MDNIVATIGTRPKDTYYVHWNLGKRCNFDCVYCPDSLHDMTSPHRSLENLIDISQKIENNIDHPYIRVWFTGGEPTVNPAFLDFCRYLNTRPRFKLGLNSNATRTTDYYLELSDYVNSLQFSSHFDYCKDDEFKEKALSVHNKIGHKFSVNLMMEPEHWDRATSMVDFCKEHKILHHMKRIRPKGTAYIPPYRLEQIDYILRS